MKKALGRPKKQRKRDLNEPRNPYKIKKCVKDLRCGKCRKVGHNARTCPENEKNKNKPTKKQKKQKVIYLSLILMQGYVFKLDTYASLCT